MQCGNKQEDVRVIITVLGADRPGIVAAVTKVLADHNVNILDISQTIVQDIFTMTMLADLTQTNLCFNELADELKNLEEELKLNIKIQREEVFTFMHRL